MKTEIFNHDNFICKIADLITEIRAEINALNPEFSGEQDEINKFLDIQESLEAAEYDMQNLKTKKLQGKYENVY